MNAIIVDDERLARVELRRLLAGHPEVTIVGEAPGCEEALALVGRAAPDLMFLDIEMPGMTGFDLLERLEDVPPVIFTTAYDAYAIRAFEVNAIDYLLKPVAPARLAAAIARVVPRAAQRRARPALTQVFVRDGERCWIVRLADVFLLESEGNYTRLYFGKERPLIRRSLNALTDRLDPTVYFRANRTQAINLPWILKAESSLTGGLIVTLRNGQTVDVSRRQALRLREKLSL